MPYDSSHDTLIEAIHNIIDDRVAQQLERRLYAIIEESLASVESFDINDHQGEIEDMIEEKIRDMTFTVTVD